MHLVGFIIRNYHNTRSPERQKASINHAQPPHVPPYIWSRYNRLSIFNSSVQTIDVRIFTAKNFPNPTFVRNRIKNSFHRQTPVRGRIQFCTRRDNWQTRNGTLINDFIEKYFRRYLFFSKLPRPSVFISTGLKTARQRRAENQERQSNARFSAANKTASQRC